MMPEKDLNNIQEKKSINSNEILPQRLKQINAAITALFFLPPIPKADVLNEIYPFSPDLKSKSNIQVVANPEISKPLSVGRNGQPIVEISDDFQKPLNLPAAREIKNPIPEKINKNIEIPGLRFDQFSGYLFGEESNPYGLEAGELAGFLKENALTVKNEKGEIKKEDCLGLVSKVGDFIQKETFEKTQKRLMMIPFDLTVTKDLQVQELKLAGEEIGKKILAFNVPNGTEILAPLSGGWGLIKPFPNVEDNCFFTDWNLGQEGQLGGFDIYFKDAEILAEMSQELSVVNPKTGIKQPLMSTKVELGDSLARINSQTSLEEFSKSGWGEFQVVSLLKNNDEIMGIESGSDSYKVFIFNQ